MGGRQLEAMALIGLGIRRLSITPASVGPIKQMVRTLDVAALEQAMIGWLANPPSDLRTAVSDWAIAQKVALD